MSVNSSSNSSLHHPPIFCFPERSLPVFTPLFVSYLLLLLPLFILVLYLGYERWMKQRSVATAAKMSHSDIFTFHMVVLELMGVLGSVFYCYGLYANQRSVLTVGVSIFVIVSPGQTLFHLLTCVERYLAVVHPITYRGLRQAGGVRIRNISIGCVWLCCFGSPGLSKINVDFTVIYTLLLLVFSCIVVSFCSLSVLCVLIRPGPGEVGGNREQVDQSKQRAFYTIVAIMGTLLLRLLSNLMSYVLYFSSVLISGEMCFIMWCFAWFSLPSSLVLPLLFLHRAGKLPGCKRNTESG